MERYKNQEEIAQWQAYQRGKKYMVRWLQLITLLLATALTFVAALHTSTWLEWASAACAALSLGTTVYLMSIPRKTPTDRLLQSMRKPEN